MFHGESRPAILPALIALGVVCLLWYTHTFAVNLLFSDQIDLFFNYPDEPGLYQLYMQQHGPHRQGLGALFMYPAMLASDWNVRSIAFLTLACMLLQAIALLYLSREFELSLPTSAVLVVLSLSLGSAELLTITPNISHSTLPMALTALLALTMARLNYSWRSKVVEAFLGISLLFTGFGIFAFLAWCCICVVRVFLAWRDTGRIVGLAARSNLLFLILAAAALGVFFTNYSVSQAGGCASTALSNPLAVLEFMAAICSTLIPGGRWTFPWIGYFVLAAYVVAAIACLVMLWRKQEQALVPLLFLLTALAFVFNAALGRHCLGLESAPASRYYILMAGGAIGTFIAAELHAKSHNAMKRWKHVCASSAALLILVTLTLVSLSGIRLSLGFTEHKKAFQRCIQTSTVVECNSQYRIYPPDSARLEAALEKMGQL